MASLFGDLGQGVSDIFAYEATGYKEQGLQFEKENYEAASALALQNKEFTQQSTAIKEMQASRQLYLSLGQTQAALGASNLSTSGSALDILRSSASQGAMTKAVIGQQGLITEAGYQEQSDAYNNMAKAADVAIQAEKTAGIGDLIGVGLSFAAAGFDTFGAIAGGGNSSGGGGGGADILAQMPTDI